MKIVLSKHAKQRLVERKITMGDLENALEMPDYVINRGNKTESVKKIKDKVLRVFYTKEDNFIKIITLMWR